MSSGGRLVLVLRGDFYARLAELPWLAEYAQRAPLLVGPMREHELARVVTEPARRVGIDVDPAVVDVVLDDAAGQPQPLPLISLALVRAWEHRNADTITIESYESGLGVAGAIEATAEAVYQAMDTDRRTEARRLLVRLAAREGTGWVRHPLARPLTTTATLAAAIDALASGRLIAVTSSRIELSHDALLEHWPRLRRWLDERAAAVELLEHLAAASAAWLSAGRPATDLYRGPRLQAVLDWQQDHPQDISRRGQHVPAGVGRGRRRRTQRGPVPRRRRATRASPATSSGRRAGVRPRRRGGRCPGCGGRALGREPVGGRSAAGGTARLTRAGSPHCPCPLPTSQPPPFSRRPATG